MCPFNVYWTVFLSIHKYILSAAAEHFQRNTIFSWHSRTATLPTPRTPRSVAVCNSGKFWHVAICVGLNAVLKINRCYTQQGRLIAIAEQRASAEYDKSLPRETGSFKKNRCSVAFRRPSQHSAAANIPRLCLPFTITKSRWRNKLLKQIIQIDSKTYILCLILLS